MDDDIETFQSSQEFDSDVDIGMKASTYTSATLKEMYTVGLRLRNNLHNCTSAGTRTGHHMHQILLE
jgi:hypothetical protein